MCPVVCFHREIVDNHEKENALNIVTDERTYQVFAESPEDARCAGERKVSEKMCVFKVLTMHLCLQWLV